MLFDEVSQKPSVPPAGISRMLVYAAVRDADTTDFNSFSAGESRLITPPSQPA
jgi:hypothetical protein